ncbi:MAG TPA: hypothetical protein VK974_02405 [Methylophilaceae bacterium]|nr:hypothetical protein [Methylophilaceae bacterium]
MVVKAKLKNLNQAPSPDNRGLAKDTPESVDDEAAKSNRDVGALEKKSSGTAKNAGQKKPH